MDGDKEVDYTKIAKEARLKVLELVYKAGTSHIGSNFSAIDIMTVLFENVDVKKDEVILSAGWKAASWYYFLWRKGIISTSELESFCKEVDCDNCVALNELVGCKKCNNKRKIQSPWIGLVEPMNRWGLRFAGGSMSYGLPFAVGVALVKKMKGEEGKVYCLMSDGELNSGTIWESALIANQHNLSNLVVIVDNNGLQAMGRTEDILDVKILWEKWKAFGWFFWNINGHNFKEIEMVLTGNPKNYTEELRKFLKKTSNSPCIVIAKTIKGKGVSFMENNNLYHYKHITDEEYQSALKESGV